MEDSNKKKKIRQFKVVYAFAVVLALGAALFAKVQTEKSLGNLKVPIESDYTLTTAEKMTVKEDEQVRINLTNVPDTRDYETQEQAQTEPMTEEITEEIKFARPYEDYYAFPFGKEVIKSYSEGKLVYSETMNDWRVHNGVDFSGEDGGEVKAIAYGTVTEVTTDALYGVQVTIDHGNGVIAKYCGLNGDTVQVKSGETVECNYRLGYLGSIPCEKQEKPHLHFEIIYNGKATDPMALMGKS